MARAGLGNSWKCLFANDIDPKKGITYRRNYGAGELLTGDVRDIRPDSLPGRANLIWGSFPCQDLSLAGARAGLKGSRSGTFWPFWDVVRGLVASNRAPEIIALENVVGTLHSHNGEDFAAICAALQGAGYHYGAMVVDAKLFLPQSRPRLFIIGVRGDVQTPGAVRRYDALPMWGSSALQAAFGKLAGDLQRRWIWFDMPPPPPRLVTLADLIEDNPGGVKWHTAAETERLLAMMSDINSAKIKEAGRLSKQSGQRIVGSIYKRLRRDENGHKVQRAEVRFDGLAGCLRTPTGGSSRQFIIVVEGGKARSRLISSRETARLMGLPDDYALPENYNEAYHLTGDGVVAPVVRHISENILTPIMMHQRERPREREENAGAAPKEGHALVIA